MDPRCPTLALRGHVPGTAGHELIQPPVSEPHRPCPAVAARRSPPPSTNDVECGRSPESRGGCCCSAWGRRTSPRDVCARRMRAAGIDAVAELASVATTWPAAPDLTVVAISAGGSSIETLQAIDAHIGTSRVIALTTVVDSEFADAMRRGRADARRGRSGRRGLPHLPQHDRLPAGARVAARRATEPRRSAATLPRRQPPICLAACIGVARRRARVRRRADGLWLLAPAERISSALQGALMVREGPRRRADGCETGDWSHVDVYLTKTLDYRAIVLHRLTPGRRRSTLAGATGIDQRGRRRHLSRGALPGAVRRRRRCPRGIAHRAADRRTGGMRVVASETQ